MTPTRVLPIFSILALVTVEYGGYALLNVLTSDPALQASQEQFFRAGHAHAGVLLVLSLVYFIYLGRTAYAVGGQWAAGATLLLGILCQSGGFFLHMLSGEPGERSPGTTITTLGAVLIAAALITLAVGLIRSPGVPSKPAALSDQ